MAAAANVLRRTAEAFAHSGAHLWRNSVPAAAPATQLAPAWVFLGPPGVGKGTYSSRVAEALGIPHISAGDLVRDEIKSGSRHGQQVVAAYHRVQSCCVRCARQAFHRTALSSLEMLRFVFTMQAATPLHMFADACWAECIWKLADLRFNSLPPPPFRHRRPHLLLPVGYPVLPTGGARAVFGCCVTIGAPTLFTRCPEQRCKQSFREF